MPAPASVITAPPCAARHYRPCLWHSHIPPSYQARVAPDGMPPFLLHREGHSQAPPSHQSHKCLPLSQSWCSECRGPAMDVHSHKVQGIFLCSILHFIHYYKWIYSSHVTKLNSAKYLLHFSVEEQVTHFPAIQHKLKLFLAALHRG